MTNFVEPNLQKYESFKELSETDSTSESISELLGTKFTFTDLFNLDNAFILAEPGYGKTRLLKEIVIKATNNGKEAIYLDLKNVNKNLITFIEEQSCSARKSSTIHTDSELLNTNSVKSEKYKLQNSNNSIICLDALDEITLGKEFSDKIDQIKLLYKTYPECKIIITCRYHHFFKYQNIFFDFKFNYIHISPFSVQKATIFLEKCGFSKESIESLINLLSFKNRKLIIQVPRYLDMIGKLARIKGIDYVRKLNRAELFEHFIYRKLEVEEQKTGIKKKELIKRVLEKLALIMEIYQTNKVSKDELISFFDDVNSNLNISFLQQVQLEIFYDKSLIKDNITHIEFENTEFQEYLAAKEINRIGRTDQVIFDLAIDHEINAIIPSWFNTLGFVVDLNISLLKGLLDFGKRNSSFLKDEEYHKLLTKVNVESLPFEQRKQIFEDVFLYYQNVLHWIRFEIAENLMYYFDSSHFEILKKTIDGRKTKGTALIIKRCNATFVITFLIKNNKLTKTELKFWKTKLIEFIQKSEKDENKVLQRHVLLALQQFKDISIIKKIYSKLDLENKLVLDRLLITLREIDPNHQFALTCFIEGTKKGSIINARYGFYEVKDRKAIIYFINHLKNDSAFFYKFVNHESIFKDKEQILIDNIINVFNREIYNSLIKLIHHTFLDINLWATQKSKFIKRIIHLLKEKKSSFIFDLIKSLKKSSILNREMHNYSNIFSEILKKDQIDEFVNCLNDINKGNDCALMTFFNIKYSKRNDSNEIYELGRKYFFEDYKKQETAIKRNSSKVRDDDYELSKLYKHFLIQLEPQKGKYSSDVFRFFVENEENLNKIITVEAKNRLIDLVNNSVFPKIDPLSQHLKINSKNVDRTEYNTTNLIHIFGYCIRIAQAFHLDISTYRQKIINFIPFAYYHDLEIILELVPDPEFREIKTLLSVYTNARDDDLSKFMPDSFIRACKHYKIQNSVSILKSMVGNNDISSYDRNLALEAISFIKPDKEFYSEVFEAYYATNNDLKRLAYKANEYLINQFSDQESILWRVNKIKDNVFPFIEIWEAHSVGSNESELHENIFAQPLMKLKDEKHLNLFFDLLEFSFNLVEKGKEYWAYTQYIWGIVYSYFFNLREQKNYEHLRLLENFVNLYSNKEGINWFKLKILNLKKEYISYIGSSNVFTDCIKKYNQIKGGQYLEIGNSNDLINLVKEIIKHDLKRFIESEGFYKSIGYLKGKQEDIIQKTLKIELDNCFLRRGFRKNEISIRREEQLLDDKRTDFLISYGFIGPVFIEIKRLNNKEIYLLKERELYKKKMFQYIEGTKSVYGFFILFQTDNRYKLDKHYPIITKLYEDISNIEVIGLNCVIN